MGPYAAVCYFHKGGVAIVFFFLWLVLRSSLAWLTEKIILYYLYVPKHEVKLWSTKLNSNEEMENLAEKAVKANSVVVPFRRRLREKSPAPVSVAAKKKNTKIESQLRRRVGALNLSEDYYCQTALAADVNNDLVQGQVTVVPTTLSTSLRSLEGGLEDHGSLAHEMEAQPQDSGDINNSMSNSYNSINSSNSPSNYYSTTSNSNCNSKSNLNKFNTKKSKKSSHLNLTNFFCGLILFFDLKRIWYQLSCHFMDHYLVPMRPRPWTLCLAGYCQDFGGFN